MKLENGPDLSRNSIIVSFYACLLISSGDSWLDLNLLLLGDKKSIFVLFLYCSGDLVSFMFDIGA